MLARIFAILTLTGIAATGISGCSGTNPFVDDDAGTGGSTGAITIPDELKGDLTKISYTPGAVTITVEGISLDGNNRSTTYNRRAALDVPGYIAYTAQNDPLDRHSTAFVAQSRNSGSVRAGVVVTGGQFNRVFSGNFYERTGGFSRTTGLVSYAGTYVGLLNGGGNGSDLLPVPAGTDPSVVPGQAGTVTASVFLNADFADGQVNGAIYNRVWREQNNGAGQALPSIVLIATDIATDGTFHGANVEYDGLVGTDIGDYGGIFGGPDADAVGGAVVLTEWDGENNPLGLETELEWGVFVLDRCGTADANATACAQVNDP